MIEWNKYFYYNNGELYWKYKQNNAHDITKAISSISNCGYIQVKFKGKTLSVHRIIWEMINGAIPLDSQIDHINRVRSDNRIENLRLVNKNQNQFNRSKNKGSEFKGVHKLKTTGNYQARIGFKQNKIYIGTYRSAVEAAKAYDEYAIKLHGVFAITNKSLGLLNDIV